MTCLNDHVTKLEAEHDRLNLEMAKGEVSGFGEATGSQFLKFRTKPAA